MKELLSADVLDELTPAVESAYEQTIKERQVRQGIQPIYVSELLTRAAGLPHDTDDPLEYGPVLRKSFQEHEAQFVESNVDLRSILEHSLLVNILTEDNLPYYTSRFLDIASSNEPLRTWTKEWTAQEHPHGPALLEYGRMAGIIGNVVSSGSYDAGLASQLRHGLDPKLPVHTLFKGILYPTVQEPATLFDHQYTGFALDKPGRAVTLEIVRDEASHSKFYLSIAKELVRLFPDNTIVAFHEIYKDFEMPGLAIPDFQEHSAAIALSGIFDKMTITNIIANLVRRLDIAKADCKTDAGKAAQEELTKLSDESYARKVGRVAAMTKLRESAIKRAKQNGQPLPFIIKHTVDFIDVGTGADRRKQLLPIA